jgi:hypothetical protein
MSHPNVYIYTIIAGSAPGSKGNPVFVVVAGPDPYTLAFLTAIFAVIAAILGSLAAFVLANHAQENRDRVSRLIAERTSYREIDRALWAFAAAADSLIERLDIMIELSVGAVAGDSLESFDSSRFVLLAAGTGLDLYALQPLIRDEFDLRLAIDQYKNNPDTFKLQGLKAVAKRVQKHIKNARDSASTLRTQTRTELNNIRIRLDAKPKRHVFGLGALKN